MGMAASAIKILREYERGVIFRLGRVMGCKGPGLIFIIPRVDKLLRISLRTGALEIPPPEEMGSKRWVTRSIQSSRG